MDSQNQLVSTLTTAAATTTTHTTSLPSSASTSGPLSPLTFPSSHGPPSDWSPLPSPTTNELTLSLTSGLQPCTPLEILPLTDELILEEPSESGESTNTNPPPEMPELNPQASLMNIFHNVVQHYNETMNTNIPNPFAIPTTQPIPFQPPTNQNHQPSVSNYVPFQFFPHPITTPLPTSTTINPSTQLSSATTSQLPSPAATQPSTPRIPVHSRLTPLHTTTATNTNPFFPPPALVSPINNTHQNRDIDITPPQHYPNLFPQNHHLTQTTLTPTPYKFKVPATNFDNDHHISKASKMTSL